MRLRITCWARRLAAALATLSCSSVASAQERPSPTRVDVAPGVYLFRTEPWLNIGNEGNSVVVVGEDGVLVFDTNGTVIGAQKVLAAIRTLTDKPVRWIVNSHWHWDHWYGTAAYKSVFPEVSVIAHEKTRAMMMGPALDFNRPGVEEQLPGFITSLEKRLAELETAALPPVDLARTRDVLNVARGYLEQKRDVPLVFPDMTFTDSLEIDLGGRTVQVLNRGRAVTPGDAFLWLPEDRVLITGDLLIDPVTYALSVFPTEWLETMEYLDSLGAAVVVPGHGAPLYDEAHLHATMDAMRFLLLEGRVARDRGLGVDAAREEILSRMRDIMVRITGDDPQVNEQFSTLFVDWYLHRVWEEAEGPLSDAISPIPIH